MQTRGVVPELAAPFSTPATPPVEPTRSELLQALVERDAEIVRLATTVRVLRQRCLDYEVALINTLPRDPQG